MRSLIKIAAYLCLLLTVWSAAAVVAHHHASNSESLTCPVCVAARAPAAITGTSGAKPVFLFLSTVRSEAVPAKYRLVVFALSIRPPPTA